MTEQSTPETQTTTPADTVDAVFDEYHRKGIFRGYSRRPSKGQKTTFRMTWHYGRMFECLLDNERGTLRFPTLLPGVPNDSPMYAAFKTYVKARQDDDRPSHRRIDKAKAQVKTYNSKGNVSLSIKVLDDDYEYAARKLINLVHEIYLDFLRTGPYYEYLVQTMGLDEDQF